MLDSGANIVAIYLENVIQKLPTHTFLRASTATGALMESTAKEMLAFKHRLNNAPQQCFQGHVLPSLAMHTIVGMGVLCGHGYMVVLTASKAYILHNNKLLLTGAIKKGTIVMFEPVGL